MYVFLVLGNSSLKIMEKRVDTALLKFQELKKEKCYMILSGGGKHETEADYMYKYACKYVDKEYLICEDKSISTFENLIFSSNVIRDLFPKETINLIICTSSFNLKRTIIMANLLLKEKNYNLFFIHTNEFITVEEGKRELQLIDQFMTYYLNNI
jgi:uncharacterized SAM-binding protein YcdF (DUF218 family)